MRAGVTLLLAAEFLGPVLGGGASSTQHWDLKLKSVRDVQISMKLSALSI